MRLVTYDNCGQPTPGVRIGARVHDLGWLAPSLEVVVALMAEGLETLEGVEQAPSLALDEVTLLPPLLQPGKIVCISGVVIATG